MAFSLGRSARVAPEPGVQLSGVRGATEGDSGESSRTCCIPLPSARGLCNAIQSFLAQFTTTVTPQQTTDTGAASTAAPLVTTPPGPMAGAGALMSTVSGPPNAVSKEALAASDVKAQAMGSETPSSDKDYSVTGKNPQAGTVEVSTDSRTEVVDTFRALFTDTPTKTLAEAIEACGTPPRNETGSVGRRKLTPESTSTALGLLKENKSNWFDTLRQIDAFKSSDGCTQAQRDICDQLLFDIRQLQTDIVDKLTLAINSDFSSITETGVVKELNRMVGDISGGKEAGTLFDTNFYTNHKALSKGIDLKSPEAKETWKMNNEINAAVKRAQQYPEMHIGADGVIDMDAAKADYYVYVDKQLAGLDGPAKDSMKEIYDKAWTKMEAREHAIHDAKAAIEAAGADGLTESEITLKAMNRCYEAALEGVETKLSDLTLMEDALKGMPEGPDRDALQVAMESALESTIQAQSEALLFANEPYYAQATIVDVVVGMQMSKGVPESFANGLRAGNPTMTRGEILGRWQAQLKEDYPILNDPDGQRIASQENFADLCKCKNEYKITDNKSAEHHLKKASKYADRALELMLTAANASSKPNAEFKETIKEITAQNKLIYNIRQGKAMMPEGKTFASMLLDAPRFRAFAEAADPPVDLSSSKSVAECFHDFMETIEAQAKTNV